MDPKRKKRPPAKVVKRIAEMKADRRRDLVKGALGLGAAVLLVVAKTALELCGLVSPENVAFVNLLLLMAMGLAIVTGTASIDFAKKGKAIRELCQEQGLSENDAKDMGLLCMPAWQAAGQDLRHRRSSWPPGWLLLRQGMSGT